MAIDKLQEKIRKMKNPLVIDFGMLPEHIPASFWNNDREFLSAYQAYSTQLLDGMKSIVPAVRFDFGAFALHGAEGLNVLADLLQKAKALAYYVFLDGVESLSGAAADQAALMLFSPQCQWTFDGLIISSYIGSDGITPYTNRMKQTDKDLFLVARTSNRSAAEMQDLLTGSRLAYVAKADIANRFSQSYVGRSGYSRVALVAAASSADCLRTLRGKYKDMFILLDGCDYPNANAKNCSYAFDQLGHGAIACAGYSVSGAWREDENCEDGIVAAVRAAERHKKNLTRYVSIL